MNLVTRLAGAVLHERSGRRRAGYASAAVLVLGWVLVQLAWLNPGRLLVLEPLSAERVTWVIWGAAAALGVVTVLVGLRRRWGLPLAGVGVALVLLVTGVVAVNRHAHADTDPGYRQASEAVAAASPDGRLEVVTTTHRGDGGIWYEEYHVESREGLWSRRGDFIAVLDHPAAGTGPRIGGVRFAGERAIELTTTDGRQWTVALDPATVEASHTLHTCDDAGGLCWMPVVDSER